MLLLWIVLAINASCFSGYLVCLVQSCGHLLGPLDWDLLDHDYVKFSFVFVTCLCGVLGQVRLLIVLAFSLSLIISKRLLRTMFPWNGKIRDNSGIHIPINTCDMLISKEKGQLLLTILI